MLIGQANDFAGIRTLQYPDAAAIAACWRELPRRGACFLTCRSEELASTLQCLEQSGFHGLQINPAGFATRSVEIRANKGKQGPCWETGRSARYQGLALAALDDDNHLLVGEMRVCEKTAAVYQGEAYRGLVTVGEADPALLARLDHDPEPFDCDTLERDAADLAARLRPAEAGERQPLFYGGPFRALVLDDGTVLRRGQVVLVPAGAVAGLRREGCAVVPDATPVPGISFQEAYAECGASCLLGELPMADSFSAPVQLRLEALSEADEEMRQRLRRIIDRGDKQFVLTGSDPRVQWGCCPSDAVYEANRLVEAGILMCWRAPVPPDACPTTIYACAGELHAEQGRPVARIDQAFRARVYEALDG